MTLSLISTLLALGIAGPQATGSVTNVEVASNDAKGTAIFRVTGSNPCGAVHFIYGDGKAITHPISELPATITYTYTASGDYTVVVQGMGNCRGEVSTRLRATVPPAAAPPPQPASDRPAARGRGRGRGAGMADAGADNAAIRFADMDADGDRVVTRNEWRGNGPSFGVHDWNEDGVLSGIEVQTEAARRRTFQEFDRDANGQVPLAEWRYGTEAFRRLDRNDDRILTMAEFAATDVGDVRTNRFDELDVNDDGYLSGTEWRGDAEAFRWLDIDNDRRLSRAEVIGDQPRRAAAQDTTDGVRLALRVPGDVAWRDTGLLVRAGEDVIIRASGEIRWTDRASDRANAAGSLSGARTAGAPLPGLPAGALIARVGQSEPFLAVARGGRIRMPQSGRLMLGINDDNVSDNGGEFEVTIEIIR
jgi:hypothetical protein